MWVHTSNDESNNKGLKTTTDYRFYQISSTFPEFSNEGKTLVLQLTVANPQKLDCGGGYVKLLPKGFDQNDFSGDTKYFVMFGPDICGPTRRVHAILHYKGENVLVKQNIPAETDTWPHVYTFIINSDQTVQVLVDNVEKLGGDIASNWDVLPPKQIKDPKQQKPADWVDDEFIVDTSVQKPEGYDDIPSFIADPEAQKPEDWDSELDGDWEAPLIPNPDYKGPWEQPTIPNTEYKGEWVHPLIDNPDYVYDDKIYAFNNVGGIGIEIWQVKAGTIFDDILITSDVAKASAAAEKILARVAEEKEAKSKADAKAKAEQEAEEARLADELEEEEAEGHVHEEL